MVQVTPELVAIGGAVVTVVAAGAYAYLSGRTASVDLDDDGTDEVTFGGEEEGDDQFGDGGGEDDPLDAAVTVAPAEVRDIGSDLTQVTGIGETRASDFDQAGFTTASDLYFASDEDILTVDGIGPRALEQIRGDIGSVDDE